jgi:hypothetical protein
MLHRLAIPLIGTTRLGTVVLGTMIIGASLSLPLAAAHAQQSNAEAAQSAPSGGPPLQGSYSSDANRLELAHPNHAGQFGPDPLYWPDRAFKNIDCDLPSSGCPTDETAR